MRRLALVTQDGSGSAALDVATAHALLQRVARGATPSTLRIYRPTATVAFGRLDALRPRFADAAGVARELGFEPVVRAPGGRAAAYDGDSVVLELAVAEPGAVAGVQERFAGHAELLAAALRSLGADARVGEVPGEYCPGAHSVNAGGRTKLAGTAQRIVRGAWLFGTSIVVRDAAPVRAVLSAVYERLAIEWDPATVAAVADTVPGVRVGDVERALVATFGDAYALQPGALDVATLAAARARAHLHVAA